MNDSRNVQPKKGLRISWRGATLVLVFFLLALFAVQNFQMVQVNLFGMQLNMPVWLLVSVVFVLGMFLGGAVRGVTRKLRKPKTPHS
jgi:uncharacterized integral membrane protein